MMDQADRNRQALERLGAQGVYCFARGIIAARTNFLVDTEFICRTENFRYVKISISTDNREYSTRLKRNSSFKASCFVFRSAKVQKRVCSKNAASPNGSRRATRDIASGGAGDALATRGELETMEPAIYST